MAAEMNTEIEHEKPVVEHGLEMVDQAHRSSGEDKAVVDEPVGEDDQLRQERVTAKAWLCVGVRHCPSSRPRIRLGARYIAKNGKYG